MRCDRNDDDLTPRCAVVPEDSVGGRRFALGVGRKHLFTVRTLQACVFVGVKTRMVQVGLFDLWLRPHRRGCARPVSWQRSNNQRDSPWWNGYASRSDPVRSSDSVADVGEGADGIPTFAGAGGCG